MDMKPSLSAYVSLTALFLSIILAGTTDANASPPLALIGFTQPDPHHLHLRFNRQFGAAALARLPKVPSVLTSRHLPATAKMDVVRRKRELHITLHEDARNSEYSLLLLFYTNCDPKKMPAASDLKAIDAACAQTDYLELVRQPPYWLRQTFEFTRKKGYTLAGRRSIRIGNNQPTALSPIEMVGVPNIDLSGIDVSDLSPKLARYPSLVTAAKIVRMLWSKPPRSGPISVSYGNYLKERFQDKLKDLRTGKFSVMCQGMRDLFIHATFAFPNVHARAVEAVNYTQAYPDLITYGHSTAEVWVPEIGKWVIVDPWIGISVINSRGQLLSARDLSQANRADVRPLPLLPEVRRYVETASGKSIKLTFRPAKVTMRRYTFWPNGHDPGYLIYFHHIGYHKITSVRAVSLHDHP